MTLDEKVGQLVTVWEHKDKVQTPDGTFAPDKASAAFPNGLGQIAKETGDLEKAEKELGRAEATLVGLYGPRHPQLVVVRSNRAGVAEASANRIRAQGDMPKAKKEIDAVLQPCGTPGSGGPGHGSARSASSRTCTSKRVFLLIFLRKV